MFQTPRIEVVATQPGPRRGQKCPQKPFVHSEGATLPTKRLQRQARGVKWGKTKPQQDGLLGLRGLQEPHSVKGLSGIRGNALVADGRQRDERKALILTAVLDPSNNAVERNLVAGELEPVTNGNREGVTNQDAFDADLVSATVEAVSDGQAARVLHLVVALKGAGDGVGLDGDVRRG